MNQHMWINSIIPFVLEFISNSKILSLNEVLKFHPSIIIYLTCFIMLYIRNLIAYISIYSLHNPLRFSWEMPFKPKNPYRPLMLLSPLVLCPWPSPLPYFEREADATKRRILREKGKSTLAKGTNNVEGCSV